MTKQQIIEQTNAFLIHTLDFEETQITPDAELRRDLGITSVDAIAIASFAQKTFDCAIDMRKVKAIITLEDLYNYIENQSHINK